MYSQDAIDQDIRIAIDALVKILQHRGIELTQSTQNMLVDLICEKVRVVA